MYLRYHTIVDPEDEPRLIKIDLKKVHMISWRFGYNSKQERTHFYASYLDEYQQKTSLYTPISQLLDREALFEYMNTNHKDKCLEK